ncbi:hypothetical protein JCM8202_002316 [Rhodotorula sphaerocarpa]
MRRKRSQTASLIEPVTAGGRTGDGEGEGPSPTMLPASDTAAGAEPLAPASASTWRLGMEPSAFGPPLAVTIAPFPLPVPPRRLIYPISSHDGPPLSTGSSASSASEATLFDPSPFPSPGFLPLGPSPFVPVAAELAYHPYGGPTCLAGRPHPDEAAYLEQLVPPLLPGGHGGSSTLNALGVQGLYAAGPPLGPFVSPSFAPAPPLASGFALPISSAAAQISLAPPPSLPYRAPVPWSSGTAPPSLRNRPLKNAPVTSPTSATKDLAPRWDVLRQQIQEGEHPRSRGTCKFFNPQTGFGYIVDDRAEEIGTDVFVHFTGIEQSHGFRCLSPGERVEYFLTQNSAGRVQALKVVGEHGSQLAGLANPVQASRVRVAARRRSPGMGGSSSRGDSTASAPSLHGDGARSRKPRVVPIPPSQLLGLVQPCETA